MRIDLTPEQSDFVSFAIESGRVADAEQAVQQAMTVWIALERRRVELLESLEAAEASLARGDGISITQHSVVALAQDVMQRNLHRFASKPALD